MRISNQGRPGLAISGISRQNNFFMRYMRRLFLLSLCMLPALAGAADHYHLARVLVAGSERLS